MNTLLLAVLLPATAVLLVAGSPCPADWRQSGSWCYLSNSSSSMSWAGANALCQEHGGALATINNRSKLLDVVDLLRGQSVNH
ncbi:galactose-specific lectin nattectin-like [Pollicipes pollicipes]|uniref:galactose-specific lectin nattectin-like n=1 Tax=Pollicipes pollicipes TaxID=41117 RepID=UPI001884EA65|nr:galactose-specific lectin nattectin-like [Pollicipes pollicipes]